MFDGMAMNLLHRVYCSSAKWERKSAGGHIPWVLDGLEMGSSSLDIGPGYGANIAALQGRTAHLTVAELDPALASRLVAQQRVGLEVLQADGTDLPCADESFSACTCFTMLHHIPTGELQAALFAEAFRVLASDGVFAGSDGIHSMRFRAVHVGDTYNPVDPGKLPGLLADAGFVDVATAVRGADIWFRCRKP